ncbi:MAG: F0F1 ATP synthase subunit A [Chloroflexota bacterium]|nr:MAG: ATP synthase F0 subunit A [Chloroflexota bacterium]
MRFLRNPVIQVLLASAVVGGILYALGFRMTKHDLHISAAAEPLACLGGERVGEFCSAGTFLPVTNSLVMTILVDLVLLALVFFGLRNMQLVPRGLQNVIEVVIEFFYNFALGVDRKNINKFFALPATIFLFFLVANMLALVPGVGSIGNCVAEVHAPAAEGAAEPVAESAEHSAFAGWPGSCPEGNFIIPWLRAPAADLNVTLAFAVVAVFMVEFWGFQALGLGYLGKFFNFREGVLTALVGIMELISEVMRLIAFAFRIFGNIFGGEVVLVVMAFLFPYLLPLPFYGLEVFVAFIQAVIFSVLTLIFASLAVQAHGHDDHGHAEPVESAGAH